MSMKPKLVIEVGLKEYRISYYRNINDKNSTLHRYTYNLKTAISHAYWTFEFKS